MFCGVYLQDIAKFMHCMHCIFDVYSFASTSCCDANNLEAQFELYMVGVTCVCCVCGFECNDLLNLSIKVGSGQKPKWELWSNCA